MKLEKEGQHYQIENIELRIQIQIQIQIQRTGREGEAGKRGSASNSYFLLSIILDPDKKYQKEGQNQAHLSYCQKKILSIITDSARISGSKESKISKGWSESSSSFTQSIILDPGSKAPKGGSASSSVFHIILVNYQLSWILDHTTNFIMIILTSKRTLKTL